MYRQELHTDCLDKENDFCKNKGISKGRFFVFFHDISLINGLEIDSEGNKNHILIWNRTFTMGVTNSVEITIIYLLQEILNKGNG